MSIGKLWKLLKLVFQGIKILKGDKKEKKIDGQVPGPEKIENTKQSEG